MTSDRAQQLAAWCKDLAPKRTGSYIDIGFEESSAQLRDLLKRGLIGLADVRDDPEWFFEAHRIIAAHGEAVGGGFWTRFTVQYNLFAGTIVGVGNDSQIAQLKDMQKAGQLGCFGLTEKFAGVSSGMVVETIAEFDAATREFVITSPNEGAYKNWISQGFCADKSVVIADLLVGGQSHGPHAFLIDFRVDRNGARELVPGVRLADMGRKTVANDLDNAWIAFDGVRVPESALLDKYAGIDGQGKYFEKVKGMRTMDQIGQRLFTGRVAVAQAALVFGRKLFERTRTYTDKKLCWAPNGMRPPLSMLPQLRSLFEEGEEAFAYAERYVKLCEDKLNECLRGDRIPPTKLTEAIAVAKIRAVETVIQLCFRLKQAVGSYALMEGSGFEALDGMQIAKFAEGESFVLMQKLARDRVKASGVVGAGAEEQAICVELSSGGPAEWVTKADRVYLLAELVMDRTMEQWVGSAPPRGVARPFAKL
mmetsp:Transcript_49019/g.137219  ORF Transcript_49019/g.137219 Transcript_49019/m.137219 type:complete len:479 (-) Transcript_49019:82-1518(-)